MSILTYVNRFLYSLKNERGVSEHTMRAYRNDLTEFADWLGEFAKIIDVRRISRRNVRDFSEAFAGMGMKGS